MNEPRTSEPGYSQYEDRVPERVRKHTEDLMRWWRDEGCDAERIEHLVPSVVLNAYVQGRDDAFDEMQGFVDARTPNG